MQKTTRSGGRLGLVLGVSLGFLLAGQASLAATHVVTQSGLTFTPNDITIQVGDTVDFVWTSGFHTVTDGTGSADPNVGSLFDAPLDTLNPVVSHTFTSAGDVPYFCRPHEIFLMAGIVRVQDVGPAVPMFPGGPALLLAALLLGCIPWMRRLLRERAARA